MYGAEASLTLEMLIKEGKAVIGMNNLANAEGRVVKGASNITKEVKRAEAEVDRFAKATTRINSTPIEKYRTQVERLDTVLAKGKITHDTYARAVARARTELQAAGRAQQDTLSSGALSQIGQMASGYLSISRAVQLVGDAFRHARQESDSALGTLRGLDDERRALAQLAIGEKPGTLTADLQRADAAAMASGASRSVALRSLHAAKSMGFTEHYEEVMGMHPILDASAGAVIAGKVRQMTGGQHTPRALANMLIEAGKPSEVDAETLAGPMAIAIEGGRRINASAEETMSLLSAATIHYAGRGEDQGDGKTGAARVAGDRMRAFAHKVATRLPDFAAEKPGLLASFEHVRGMEPWERAEFLQENEEIASIYEVYLAAREQANKTLANVQRAGAATGTPQDNVALGLAIRAADPASSAAIALNRAEITKESAREGALGVGAAGSATGAARAEALGYQANVGPAAQFGIATATETAKTFRLSEQNTTRFGVGAATLFGDLGLSSLFAGQEEQTNLLAQILGVLSGSGGVGRSVSAAALAPQN